MFRKRVRCEGAEMLSPLWPWHHRLEVLSLAIQEDAPAHASSHCLSNSTPLLVLSSVAFSGGSLGHLVSALRNQKLGHKNSGKPDMEWGGGPTVWGRAGATWYTGREILEEPSRPWVGREIIKF